MSTNMPDDENSAIEPTPTCVPTLLPTLCPTVTSYPTATLVPTVTVTQTATMIPTMTQIETTTMYPTVTMVETATVIPTMIPTCAPSGTMQPTLAVSPLAFRAAATDTETAKSTKAKATKRAPKKS